MPVFGSLMNKFHELSLSDLNHELGKAKESLMYGSSQYVQNFRTDAANVSTMIRSESTRFGGYIGKVKTKMPKSTSLPVIQGQENGGLATTNNGVSQKYQYRSRILGSNFSPTLSPTDMLEESVVAKFIKVVGDEVDKEGTKPKEKRKPSVRTREDILKKLTDLGEEESENDDLEICFINEKAFDDNEVIDEEDVEGKETPTAKSTNVSSILNDISEPAVFEPDDDIPDATRQFEIEKKRIKDSACQALTQCKYIARNQVLQEKQLRNTRGKLKSIIGMDYTELNSEQLKEMNFSSLQVVLNDMTECIEVFNRELVQLLISKDELQIEQESMLMDIGDILLKQ